MIQKFAMVVLALSMSALSANAMSTNEKPPHEALAHDGHVRRRPGHSTMCMRF